MVDNAWAGLAVKWMRRTFERVYDGFSAISCLTSAQACSAASNARERSRNYLQALLVQAGERRNAENLSEIGSGVPARALQRFLTLRLA